MQQAIRAFEMYRTHVWTPEEPEIDQAVAKLL